MKKENNKLGYMEFVKSICDDAIAKWGLDESIKLLVDLGLNDDVNMKYLKSKKRALRNEKIDLLIN